MPLLIAGNWKMNGMARQLGEIEAIAALVKVAPPLADVLICPPATLVARAVQTGAGRITIGGKNCYLLQDAVVIQPTSSTFCSCI